jgi:hypothetical protein
VRIVEIGGLSRLVARNRSAVSLMHALCQTVRGTRRLPAVWLQDAPDERTSRTRSGSSSSFTSLCFRLHARPYPFADLRAPELRQGR